MPLLNKGQDIQPSELIIEDEYCVATNPCNAYFKVPSEEGGSDSSMQSKGTAREVKFTQKSDVPPKTLFDISTDMDAVQECDSEHDVENNVKYVLANEPLSSTPTASTSKQKCRHTHNQNQTDQTSQLGNRNLT